MALVDHVGNALLDCLAQVGFIEVDFGFFASFHLKGGDVGGVHEAKRC